MITYDIVKWGERVKNFQKVDKFKYVQHVFRNLCKNSHDICSVKIRNNAVQKKKYTKRKQEILYFYFYLCPNQTI